MLVTASSQNDWNSMITIYASKKSFWELAIILNRVYKLVSIKCCLNSKFNHEKCWYFHRIPWESHGVSWDNGGSSNMENPEPNLM